MEPQFPPMTAHRSVSRPGRVTVTWQHRLTGERQGAKRILRDDAVKLLHDLIDAIQEIDKADEQSL